MGGRYIDLAESAKKNPKFHVRLTEDDLRYGVVVRMKLNGNDREIALSVRQMILPSLFGGPHRLAEENGKILYGLKTFASFHDFQLAIEGCFDAQLATMGARPAEIIALRYLTYASLPVWARDPQAYVRKWGAQASEFPFGRKPRTNGGNTEFKRAA